MPTDPPHEYFDTELCNHQYLVVTIKTQKLLRHLRNQDQFDQSPRRNVEQKLHNIESSLLMYAQENGMAQRLQYITNRFPLTN